MENIALKFDYKVDQWPTIYLGLPFYRKPSSLSFWQPILAKIDKRLHSWQHNHLSKGGKLTLLEPMLANQHICFLPSSKYHQKWLRTLKSVLQISCGLDTGATTYPTSFIYCALGPKKCMPLWV